MSPITERKIVYAYDELNRLVKICLEYDDISSPVYFYEITYDAQGNPTIVDIFIEAQLFLKIYYTWKGRQLFVVDITEIFPI
ncbi:MAG: hypothetical protein GX904_03790 [Acholeplasmataceae bacterium]|nr:hypothetical protein [Acholeplasmataceae bacterium]